MYLKYYHLALKPFDLSLKPGFLWLGEQHAEALATLNYGIKDDLGFLLLTGDVGAGKTALIRRLTNNLDRSTIVAHITDPGLAPLDFFKILAEEFGMGSEFHTKGEFLIALEKFLHQAYADKKKVLLIIDEAQRLNNILLDQIRVLSNIERSDCKLINIFFVGQPEFKNMLLTDSNRALHSRIAVRYHIEPLTESEIAQYIGHRLKKAGATHNVFQTDAVHEIYKYTGGYPRSINIICDHALLTGYSSGLEKIDATVIKECVQELEIQVHIEAGESDIQRPATPPPEAHPSPPEAHSAPPEAHSAPPQRSAFRGYPILIGTCIILSAFLVYHLLRPAPRRPTQPVIQNQSAGVAGQPTQTLSDGRWRLSEKIEQEQIQASSTPDTPIAREIPMPGRSTDIREDDGEVTTPQKTENPVALQPLPPAPESDIQTKAVARSTDIEKPIAQIAGDQDDPVNRQSSVSEAQAAIVPEIPADRGEADGSVPIPDKSLQALALMSAALATQPESQAEKVANQQVTKQRATAPPKKAPVVVARQPETSATQATPPPANPSDGQRSANSGSAPAKAGKSVALAAVIADAKPRKKIDSGVEPIGVTGKPEFNALKSVNNKGTKTAVSKSKTKTVAVLPMAKRSSGTVNPYTPTPVKKKTPPAIVPSPPLVKPPITANAMTQRRSANAPLGKSAALLKKTDSNSLENRLRWFLKSYCITYSEKNFTAFTNFFVPGAMENGEPFQSLLPKYKRNFAFIETIQYRIDLLQFSYDEEKEIVKIDGNFFLKWLLPGKKWRENAGKISMHLIENGPSFKVQRLDYHGDRPKKE